MYCLFVILKVLRVFGCMCVCICLWTVVVLFKLIFILFYLKAQYSLIVLKVPKNPKQLTNQPFVGNKYTFMTSSSFFLFIFGSTTLLH